MQASSGASSSHDSIRYEGIHGLVYGDGKMLPPPCFASRTQSERACAGECFTASFRVSGFETGSLDSYASEPTPNLLKHVAVAPARDVYPTRTETRVRSQEFVLLAAAAGYSMSASSMMQSKT